MLTKLLKFFTAVVPTKVHQAWNALPPKLRQWLKGAEVAVVTAVVTAFVAVPVADFKTKTGIAEFVSGVAAAAYGALRLYIAQSPVPLLVKREEVVTVSTPSARTEVASTTTTQGGS